MSDNEDISSQIVEEEDLFFDEMFFDPEENEDSIDPKDNERASMHLEVEGRSVDPAIVEGDQSVDSLRSRIAGPSAYKVVVGLRGKKDIIDRSMFAYI